MTPMLARVRELGASRFVRDRERARTGALMSTKTRVLSRIMELYSRSDDELMARVVELVGSQRELTAKLVAHLAEVESRRLHLLAGYSSMFDFCQKELSMSEGEAFRRILAARLGRRFPVVYPLLASGSLRLTTLELVREWLTDENHSEIFAAVAHKGKREVQAILATRFPQPDRPSRIRAESRVEAVSERRFRVEFSASAELCEKLERSADLMSHANPSRNLSVVIERGVDLLLEQLERRRIGKTKRSRQAAQGREDEAPSIKSATVALPSSATSSREPGARRIANAVRREVFERDGAQCSYVAEDGRRCECRAFLELDHVVAKALGGADDATNLRVRCRGHNQLAAEQVFGREWIERGKRLRQQKSTRIREGI